MEFKVLGELRTEGEKTNSKGEVVDVDFTTFSLLEQKPKGSIGVPIRISIKCEGTHKFDIMTGDIVAIQKKQGQTKLGQNPPPLVPTKKPEQKPAKAEDKSVQPAKRSHHKKK